MTFRIAIPASLTRFLDCLGSSDRHHLFSAAGNAVRILIRRHLADEATRRHFTAHRLGAEATGHLAKGARATTFTADADHAEVVIPIAGISRAFHDVDITPQNGSGFLTLPLHAYAYGMRAGRMRQHGWRLFRPAAKGAHRGENGRFDRYQNLLLGSRGDDKPVALYYLAKKVHQRQDRTLLPSDEAISSTAARAMLAAIRSEASG